MSFLYRAFYRFGITPWEEDPIRGRAAEQISLLFDREESSRTAPYGSALDLGCGTVKYLSVPPGAARLAGHWH